MTIGGVIMMNEVKELRDSINERDEASVYYNLRRLLISISWSYDSKDLEDVADALYNFLMEQKHMKDDYIEAN